MRYALERGFSLVELVVFIVIIGLSLAMVAPLVHSGKAGGGRAEQLAGMQLARARMEMILQDARSYGFASFTDPCDSVSAPAACDLPAGYSISTPTIVTGWNGNNHYKVITVALTGKATLTLTSLVSDAI